MNSVLLSLEEARSFIESNKDTPLAVAGNEDLLTQLPNGNWIGATIPYFIGREGGLKSNERVLITHFSEAASSNIHIFDEQTVGNIYDLDIKNGFGFALIPGASNTHHSFAVETLDHDFFGKFPLIGWVAGIDLDEIGTTFPKVINGTNGESFGNKALVLEIELPPGKFAGIDTVNIFEPNTDGPIIEFLEEGFHAKRARIDGEEVDFADWIKSNRIETQTPIIASLGGAHINISFQKVETDHVKFFAPVYQKTEYRLAKPIADYTQAFLSKVTDDSHSVFSCSCILNYLYSNLEGKQTGHFYGPVTFGEIGYLLHNQTTVSLFIDDKQ